MFLNSLYGYITKIIINGLIYRTQLFYITPLDILNANIQYKDIFIINKMPKAKYVLEVLEFITEKEGENGWLAQAGRLNILVK